MTGARPTQLVLIAALASLAGCASFGPQAVGLADPAGFFTSADVRNDIAMLARERKARLPARETAELGSGRAHYYVCPAVPRLVGKGTQALGPLRAALTDANPVVRRNAAIALARLGERQGVDRLADIVRAGNTASAHNLTAARTLADLDTPHARDVVGALARDEQHVNAACREVAIEALARRRDPELAGVFRAALSSPSPAVRRAGAAALADLQLEDLYPELVALACDSNRWVRLAAVRALAAHGRGDVVLDQLLTATNDKWPLIRNEAVRGLGRVKSGLSVQAVRRLRELADDRSPESREEAVRALAAAGQGALAAQAADDRNWRVRLAVAEAAGSLPAADRSRVLSALVSDRAPYVQLAVVEQAAVLPDADGAPVLIDALAQPSPKVAEAAWRHLRPKVDPSFEFASYAPVPARRRLAEGLRRWWRTRARKRQALASVRFAATSAPAPTRPVDVLTERVWLLVGRLDSARSGDVDQAVKDLVASGAGGLAVLEQDVLQVGKPASRVLVERVLPKLSPAYEALPLLDDADLGRRLRAVQLLGRRPKDRPMSDWLAERLARHLAGEPNDFIWRRLADMLAADQPSRLAPALGPGMRHAHFTVRHAAAAHAGDLKDTALVPDLARLLTDPRGMVRREAARALGRIGGPRAVAGLLFALENGDESLRLAAAIGLRRLGRPEGIDEIRRALAGSQASRRAEAVEALGVGDGREHIRDVVAALDDSATVVRRQAVLTLERITGRQFQADASGRQVTLGRQAELWRLWWRRTADAAARTRR